MDDRTTPIEFQREPLWGRLKSFLSQACGPDREFVLVPSLGAGGDEICVTRELGHGREAMDMVIGACLFSLATQIGEHIPQEGQLCFAAPSEWEWCPQHQFVEEPIRFFFERGSGGNWYLNMATEVALLPVPGRGERG